MYCRYGMRFNTIIHMLEVTLLAHQSDSPEETELTKYACECDVCAYVCNWWNMAQRQKAGKYRHQKAQIHLGHKGNFMDIFC